MKRVSVLITLYIIIILLCQQSCKRPDNADPIHTSTQNTFNGKVALPDGSNIRPEDITVTSSQGVYSVKEGGFDIPQADTTAYRVYIAEMPNSDLSLFGIKFKDETNLEISATSTAIVLLLINPITPYLSDQDKRKLIDNFKKNSLFPVLVNEIESNIIQKKDFLTDGSKVIELSHSILGSSDTFANFRLAGDKSTNDNDVRIKISFLGNIMSIQNTSSFVPYFSGIYDEKGTKLKRIDLGVASVGNISPLAWGSDLVHIVTNFRDCFDYFGTRKIPNCNLTFGKPEIPEPRTYTFDKAGKYTIKIANPAHVLKEREELSLYASGKLFVLSLQKMVSILDPDIAKKIAADDCFVEQTFEWIDENIKTAVAAPYSSRGSVIIKGISESFVKKYAGFYKCFKSEAEQKNFGKLFVKISAKIYDINKNFEILESSLNSIGMGWNLVNDKDYYELCVIVDDKGARQCNSGASGNITVSVRCLDDYTNYPFVHVNTGYSYEYKVKFNQRIEDHSNRYLMIITPDGSFFTPVKLTKIGDDIWSGSIVNECPIYSYQYSRNCKLIGGEFYDIKYINYSLLSGYDNNIYRQPSVNFLAEEKKGTYKFMIVLGNNQQESEQTSYREDRISSAVNTFSQPFFDYPSEKPCQLVGNDFQTTVQPYDISFTLNP